MTAEFDLGIKGVFYGQDVTGIFFLAKDGGVFIGHGE